MSNLKKLLYDLSYESGFSGSLVSHMQQAHKLILTYHNILPSSDLTPLFTNNVDVAIETFEFQIKSLLEKFKIHPSSEINDPNKKGIYLSFDDGMMNQIEIIEPILRKYGITAMFAVCSGLVQSNIEFIWRDTIFLMLKSVLNKKLNISCLPSISGKEITLSNLNKVASAITEYIQLNHKMDTVYKFLDEVLSVNNLVLKRDAFPKLRYSPMSITDIKYLKNNGHFIVSHTDTHRKLSMLSDMELEKELRISRNYFINELGSCDTLVYPYGTSLEVDERVMRMVRNAGYKNAFLNTMKFTENGNLFVPRINMGNVLNKSSFFGMLAGLNKLGIIWHS